MVDGRFRVGPAAGLGPSAPEAVAAVVPGVLYAVGGGIPSEVSVSWIPEGLAGWMPVQCYAFRDGPDAMVMDGGLGAHRLEIEDGLSAVLDGAPPPRLLVSRWEPDSMVNLPWLIDRFGAREILSYGGIDPLDFFERFEATSANAQVEAAAGPAHLVPISPGDVLQVGSLRIEVLTASLRLLLTSWFYEHTTRSLFTADSFGFLSNPAGPTPFVVRPAADRISPGILRRSLLTKFDWLVGAHCDALVADLEAFQAEYPIDRVCPSFGGIIEGQESVARLFHAAVAALRQLADEGARSPLAGFDWRRALGPQAVANLADPRRVPPGIGRCGIDGAAPAGVGHGRMP